MQCLFLPKDFVKPTQSKGVISCWNILHACGVTIFYYFNFNHEELNGGTFLISMELLQNLFISICISPRYNVAIYA